MTAKEKYPFPWTIGLVDRVTAGKNRKMFKSLALFSADGKRISCTEEVMGLIARTMNEANAGEMAK